MKEKLLEYVCLKDRFERFKKLANEYDRSGFEARQVLAKKLKKKFQKYSNSMNINQENKLSFGDEKNPFLLNKIELWTFETILEYFFNEKTKNSIKNTYNYFI